MPRAVDARAYNHVMAPWRAKRMTSRRQFLRAGLASTAMITGCIGAGSPQTGKFDKLWGLPGGTPGRLFRPRAIAIDKDDLLYIVDMTPQIQVFTGDGVFLRGSNATVRPRQTIGTVVQ